MITIRVNVVAFIVTLLVGLMFYTVLQNTFTPLVLAQIAIPVFITTRVYDYINSLPAFKGKPKAENRPKEQKK